jgi:propionyl-CoA carboxylase alpha chain
VYFIQTIQAGQEVAVVEAMKMQNVLRAPRAGVVLSVDAKSGDSLKVDQLIATLEPEEKVK